MIRQNWRIWPSSIDVETILAQPETKEILQATTFGGMNTDVRSSRIAWLSNNPIVHGLIKPYIDEAKVIMNVDVSPACEIQFTEYHAVENGKYDWHHDVDWNNAAGDRKLSLTVQLSDPADYDGGDFEFAEVEQLPKDMVKKKGSVVVFPSYLVHRVTPVTRGVRRSLVAWFHGPKWR